MIQGKAFAYLSLGELDSVHALVAQKLKTVDTTALLVRFSLYQETMWTLPPELWPKIVKLTPKDFDNDRGHWGLKLGHTYRLMGDTMHARMFGDSAVAGIREATARFPRSCAGSRVRGARAGARRPQAGSDDPGRQRAQAARDDERRDAPAVRALSGGARVHSVRRQRARARPDRAADHDAGERRDSPPTSASTRASRRSKEIRGSRS